MINRKHGIGTVVMFYSVCVLIFDGCTIDGDNSDLPIDCREALLEACMYGEVSDRLQARLVELHTADVINVRSRPETTVCLEQLVEIVGEQRNAVLAVLLRLPPDDHHAELSNHLDQWLSCADEFLAAAEIGSPTLLAALGRI